MTPKPPVELAAVSDAVQVQPGQSPSDLEQALTSARAGDAGAFNALVDAFQTDAYHLAYHTLGNADDALDACQEAMLSAWRAIASFEGDVSRYRRWLFTIVVNACRDRARYERRRPHEPIDREMDGNVVALPLPDPGQSPEDYAATADLGRLLEQALSVLGDEHRTVVLLDHAGLSYAEIAEAVGVEVGTVKSRLSRARAHLRDVLTGTSPIESRAEPHATERRSTTMRRKPRQDRKPGSPGLSRDAIDEGSDL